jgi:hypothetical protein
MRALNVLWNDKIVCERLLSTKGAIFAMAPKSRMKRKAEAAALASAECRKKQRASLDSTDSLATQSGSSSMAPESHSAHEAQRVLQALLQAQETWNLLLLPL